MRLRKRTRALSRRDMTGVHVPAGAHYNTLRHFGLEIIVCLVENLVVCHFGFLNLVELVAHG